MLVSTQGFVIQTTPHAETSVIVRIFTSQLGLRTYIMKGVRSHSSRQKQNLLAPFTLLDLVVYDTPRSSLNYVKDISVTSAQPPLPSDIVVNSLRFFFAEVLLRTLPEGEPLPGLFEYLVGLHGQLLKPKVDSSLPLLFLLSHANHLGIAPLNNYSIHQPLFSLSDGSFVAPYVTPDTLTPHLSLLLHHYQLSITDSSMPVPTAPLAERRELIDALLLYFQFHFSTFKDFQSHQILHAVLSE
ncbi:MAG: DNA repair protein RecO [Bacteroidales bacterium]|nr:DNA repair protein RecO [Bacteroidales bacterium]